MVTFAQNNLVKPWTQRLCLLCKTFPRCSRECFSGAERELLVSPRRMAAVSLPGQRPLRSWEARHGKFLKIAVAVTRSAGAVFSSVSAAPSSSPGAPKLVTMAHVMRKRFHKRSDGAHDGFGLKKETKKDEPLKKNFTDLFDVYFY